MSKVKVKEFFKETLGIEKGNRIDWAHRVKNRNANKINEKKKPRTIVWRLSNYKDKELVSWYAKKLKGKTSLYIKILVKRRVNLEKNCGKRLRNPEIRGR